jgi:Bacterial dnaA protein helix-turn-helix
MLLDKIQSKLDRFSFHENSFYEVTPYDSSELSSSNRKRNLVVWRSVGMVWLRLCGYSQETTAEIFNRDHTTVHHAEKQVLNALEGFDFEIKEAFYKVMNFGKDTCIRTDELGINYINSLILMENEFKKL